MFEVVPKKCAQEGCSKSYKPHKWGAIKAYNEGWFMQKNGASWCPDHHPDWVRGWR